MPQLTPTTSAGPSVISAKWTHLSELYAEESKTIIKLSQLTKSSVSPSNIEKQKVSLALNVFSEKTSSALKSSAASNPGWQETAVFIDHVLRLWKVFNTKTVIENIRMRDPDRCAVDLSPTGQKPLEILEFWADCAAKMKPQGQRIKTFTKETSDALHWTCKCLLALCNYLLTTTTALQHQYVALGFFQQDDL
ncbi:developmentally-regulated GTP-binding protein 2 [Plakobranchus ocellatus]|uniref:Developmentally-regulated GTP-binding protein 2 n=1 Tax=Plakobranchus ocellatus TaxID=259542 RepID=A0AAV4AHR9_9GAST|nr:developmentally-regulated GTP-binding protein 2 [Plakobranchus ocellatus]